MIDKGRLISRLKPNPILWASAAIVLGSAALQGAVESCPRPQPPAAESHTWDFPTEVTRTLREIEREASKAHRNASKLQVLARFPVSYARSTHLEELREAREAVNSISKRMCAACRGSDGWPNPGSRGIWIG